MHSQFRRKTQIGMTRIEPVYNNMDDYLDATDVYLLACLPACFICFAQGIPTLVNSDSRTTNIDKRLLISDRRKI
jgi:hypothetical protein